MKQLRFYPSVKEVLMAEDVFKAGIVRYNDGNNGKHCVIQCALADVWEAARRYEHEKRREVKLLED